MLRTDAGSTYIPLEEAKPALGVASAELSGVMGAADVSGTKGAAEVSDDASEIGAAVVSGALVAPGVTVTVL